jgi:hypothetical protein
MGDKADAVKRQLTDLAPALLDLALNANEIALAQML